MASPFMLSKPAQIMSPLSTTPILIVGAGPAGLAVAGCARKLGLDFHIIEQSGQVGSRWRQHYQRLHLHTPGNYSALPHLSFPRHSPRYPSRQQVVDYLEAYAKTFAIAPQFDTALTGLNQLQGHWRADTTQGAIDAQAVVICSGYNRVPQQPEFASEPQPPTLHSMDYRNADSIKGPRNLVVGAGNSGAEIALDLAESGRQVDLAVRGPLNVVPKEVFGLPLSTVTRFSRFLPASWAEALSRRSTQRLYGDLPDYGLKPLPYGVQCQVDQHQRVPLIDVGTIDAIRAGKIQVRPGVQSLDQQLCRFADGSLQRYDGIVLATGFRPRLEQLMPTQQGLLNAAGAPTSSGTEMAPGMWFCGFRISTRGMLNQIAREARDITRALSEQLAKQAISETKRPSQNLSPDP